MSEHDVVIRNGYEHERGAVVDVAVRDGTIAEVEGTVAGDGAREIDAGGDLVSPGLVDCHVHLDQALTADGERFPRHNDDPFDKERCIGLSADYFAGVTVDEIAETAVEVAGTFATNGTTALRTHAYVDSTVGTRIVEGILEARDRLDGVVDLQVVAFPQRGYVGDPGTADHVREALATGADLVGGIDPATVNGDIARSIEAWFDVATDADADIDAHVHDGGSLGMYTLTKLADATIDHGYEGRVTASHAFALADTADAADDPRAAGTTVAGAIDRFAEAGLKFVTCYPSTRPGHPVKRFHEAGLPMAHGSDEVRDMWVAHGNADVLEGALVESFKLSTDYAYATNPGLDALWRTLTTDAGRVLGIDGYGIREGTPADLIVWDRPSPQWAIIRQANRSHVLKDGRVIAEDGALVPEVAADLGG